MLKPRPGIGIGISEPQYQSFNHGSSGGELCFRLLPAAFLAVLMGPTADTLAASFRDQEAKEGLAVSQNTFSAQHSAI